MKSRMSWVVGAMLAGFLLAAVSAQQQPQQPAAGGPQPQQQQQRPHPKPSEGLRSRKFPLRPGNSAPPINQPNGPGSPTATQPAGLPKMQPPVNLPPGQPVHSPVRPPISRHLPTDGGPAQPAQPPTLPPQMTPPVTPQPALPRIINPVVPVTPPSLAVEAEKQQTTAQPPGTPMAGPPVVAAGPTTMPEEVKLEANALRDVSAEEVEMKLEAARRALASGPQPVPPLNPAMPNPNPAVAPAPALTGPQPPGVSVNPATGAPEVKQKEFFWLPPEERPYFFTWSKTPLEKACQDLAEMSGLPVVGLDSTFIDQNAKARLISFQSNKLLTYDEALTGFNQIIVEMNLWMVRQQNYLYIRPLTEWYRHILPERRFKSLEAYRAAKLPLWEVASLTYQPKSRPCDVLAQHAMDIVPPSTATITVLPGTNQMEMKGFVYYLEQQLIDLDRNDVRVDDGRSWVSYELRYAQPSEVIPLLQMMMPPPSAGGGTVNSTPPPRMPPRAGPPMQPGQQQQAQMENPGSSTADVVDIQDGGRQKIMVRATKANHELVKKYLDEYIDQPTLVGKKAELIPLKYAVPSTVAGILRNLLGQRVFVPNPTPQPPQPNNPNVRPPVQPPGQMMTTGTSAVIVPVPSSNSLLVKAEAEEMAFVKLYVEMLDVPPKGGGEHQYVPLKFAQGNSVAEILTSTIGSRVKGQEAGDIVFRAVADRSSDKGVVISGEPKELEEARKLIETLDVDPDAGAIERLVHLANSTPTLLSQMLGDRYSKQGGGGSRYYRGGGEGSTLPRFIPDDPSKSLIVVCRQEMWPDIDRLIKEIDSNSQVRGAPKTYHLKYASAVTISNMLQQSFGGSSRHRYDDPDAPSFQPDQQSNILLVTATDEVQKRVGKLIEELDQPSAVDSAELKAIQLTTADATYVKDKIEELFGQGQRDRYSFRGERGAPTVPVNVVAEPVSNRLLVSASPEDFKKAEDLAKRIDQDYAAKEYIRKNFTVEHIAGFELHNALMAMFPEGEGGGGNYYGRGNSGSAPGVKIAQTSNGVTVLAPKTKMAEIEKLIAEIDTDPAKGNEIRTYTIESSDYNGTYQIAQNLSDLFNPGGRYGRGSGTSSIKFIGDPGGNLLFVSAPSSKMPEIDAKVQEIAKAKQSKDMTFVIRNFDVKQGRPEDIVDMVQPLLAAKFEELQSAGGGARRSYSSPPPQITAHPTAHKVMVAAPEPLMPLVEQLVKEFDQPGELITLRMLKLKNAKASEIAPVIEQMMEKRGGSGSSGSGFGYRSSRGFSDYYSGRGSSSGSAGADTLQVSAVDASNSIILRGPDKKVFEAEQLAKELDKDAVPEGIMFKVFEIKKADVYDVVSTIEEIVGGGGGSDFGDSRVKRSSGSGTVTVKADFNNRVFVAAPGEKFPLIEELIRTKESLAEMAETVKPAGKGTPLGAPDKYGEITMIYKVTGQVDQIAKVLDRQLMDVIGFDSPWVKSAPFANQIIVTGKPQYFKMVDEYLEEIQKMKLQVPRGIFVKQVQGGAQATALVDALVHQAPPGLKIHAEPMNRKQQVKKNPLELIAPREITAETPISTQPASPFVPPNTLHHLRASLEKIAIVQVSTHPAAATQPATATRPAATTQPAPAAVVSTPARPSTMPAAAVSAAPVKPAAAPQPAAVPPQPAAAPPSAAVAANPAMQKTPAAAPPLAPAAPAPAAPVAAPMPQPVTAAAPSFDDNEVRIQYDEETGNIIVSGPIPQVKEIHTEMESLIDEFEKLGAPDATRPIRVFTINHVDVNIAAAILEEMFNDKPAGAARAGQPPQPAQPQPAKAAADDKKTKDKDKDKDEEEDTRSTRRRRREKEEGKEDKEGAERAAGGGDRIRVFPDSRTRTLVIRANEEDFGPIADLILKIDRPGDRPPVDIKVFTLKKLVAYDVEQSLKAILKIEDGSGSRFGGSGGFGRSSYRGRSSGGGYGGSFDQQAAMMEELQRQMLDMTAGTIEGLEGVPGQEGHGRLKINPSKEITITSNPTTNSVIVSAPQEGMKLVENLIKKLEDADTPMQIISVPLKHAEAEKVAIELERVFQGSTRRRSSDSGSSSSGMSGGFGFPYSGGGSGGTRGGQELRISANTRTNSLIIRALESDMAKMKEIIAILDVPTPSGQVQLYPVEHASAPEMAATLAKIFVTDEKAPVGSPLAVRITADADTNTIVVWAPEAQQAMIAARISDLDKRVQEKTEPRQIKLAVATATSVAEKLRDIFVPKGSSGKGERHRITIEGDDNSMLLFVTAPPDVFKTIETTAKQLDTITQQDIHIFKLKNAFATDVYDMFQKMVTQKLTMLKGGSSSEIPTVVPDVRTNSLIISGSPAAMMLVQKLLPDIDVKPDDTTTPTTGMFGLIKGNAIAVATTINSLYTAPNVAKFPGGVPPPTAVAEPNTNVVYVTGTKAQIDLVKATIIDPLEKYEAPISTIIKDYQIPIKYAKVDEIADTLIKYFQGKSTAAGTANVPSLSPADKAVAIVPDPATRQLLVTCSEKNKTLIDLLLKTADVQGITDLARTTRVFSLQFADPSSTTSAVTAAFAKTGNVSEIEQVKVVAETGTNSIVVSASPDNMKKIEAMLLDLDKMGNTQRRTTQVEIANADPQDVATALNEIYSKRKMTRTGEPQASVIVPRGSTHTLMVTCAELELPEVKSLVAQLDVKPGIEAPKMIKVENTSAAQLAATLTRIFADSSIKRPSTEMVPLIMSDDVSNSLVVRAGKVDLGLIEAMAGKLDTKTSVLSGIDVIPVSRGVDVRALAEQIMQTINQGEAIKTRQNPGYRAGQVMIGIDERGPSMMVAGSPELFPTVRDLVEKLRRPEPRTSKTMVIQTKNIPAADMKRILEQVINQNKAASPK